MARKHDGTIQFMLLRETARRPQRYHCGDAGFDLFVSRDAVIPPRSFVDVHSDVAVALPPGYWVHIVGRSSTIRTKGLLVNPGVIDNGWRGELLVGVWNLLEEPVLVAAGSRIAQVIVYRLEAPAWELVECLPPGDRDQRGFGSTG